MKDKSIDEIDQIEESINKFLTIISEADTTNVYESAKVVQGAAIDFKTDILALKSKWETEARIDELEQIVNKYAKNGLFDEDIESRIKELGDK